MTERELWRGYGLSYDEPRESVERAVPVGTRMDVAGSGSVMVEYHARRPSLRPLPVAAGVLRVRKVVASDG